MPSGGLKNRKIVANLKNANLPTVNDEIPQKLIIAK
jgi:hypothetical protein